MWNPLQLGTSLVVDVMLQLALGVAHMHSCGILHRDLKSDNALIQSIAPLVVKWGDYGCAVQLGKNVYGDGTWRLCFGSDYAVQQTQRHSTFVYCVSWQSWIMRTHN